MNQRFEAPVQRARQMVEAGNIGHVYHCKAYWRRRSGIPRIGSWFTRKELSGGGALLDIGVHMLDNAFYLLNNFRPRSVSGATYNEFGRRSLGESNWGISERPDREFDVDDFATALIKLEGGITVLLEAAWAMHLDRSSNMNIELHGTDGALNTYEQQLCRQENDGYHIVELSDIDELNYPHTSRMHHFVNVILEREKVCVTLNQVLTVQRVIDAIYRSAMTSQEVIFD